MSIFRWSEEYSVGVRDLDRHHQKLCDMLERLHASMKEGKAGESAEKIIYELIDYAKYHFGEEERLMARVAYSGLAEHKKAHEKFIAEVKEFEEKGRKLGAGFLSPRILMFLTDWLKHHIGGIDKQYKTAMNEKGIR